MGLYLKSTCHKPGVEARNPQDLFGLHLIVTLSTETRSKSPGDHSVVV